VAAVRAVLGDEQRFRFGQIEHLPGDVIDRHRFGQRRAARGAGVKGAPHAAQAAG
jgi:hypothetical protein